MTMRRLTGAFFLLGGLALVGCTRGPETGGVSISDVKRDVKKAVDTTGQYLNQTRKQVQQRLTDELRDLDVDLDAWKAKLSRATAEERPALEKRLRSLEQKRVEVGKQLDELREQAGPAWDQARDRVDRTMADLKKALGDAADTAKQPPP
jgi:DNA-binding transcriptional MerR regulator